MVWYDVINPNPPPNRTAQSSNAFIGFGVGLRSDRLSQAAAHYLRLGDVRAYCELQVTLGRWEKALSAAPGVSVAYWKALCVRYGQSVLQNQGSGSAEGEGGVSAVVPVWLAAGQVAPVIAAQLSAGKESGGGGGEGVGDSAVMDEALVTAVSEAVRALPLPVEDGTCHLWW